jgi:hypothetical protein
MPNWILTGSQVRIEDRKEMKKLALGHLVRNR